MDAFLAYIEDQQDDAASTSRPVVIQEIQGPEGAVATGGTPLSLPLMIFLVTAAAFVVLAILLDRLFPAGSSRPIRAPEAGSLRPVEEPELGEASSASERERHAQARSRV